MKKLVLTIALIASVAITTNAQKEIKLASSNVSIEKEINKNATCGTKKDSCATVSKEIETQKKYTKNGSNWARSF